MVQYIGRRFAVLVAARQIDVVATHRRRHIVDGAGQVGKSVHFCFVARDIQMDAVDGFKTMLSVVASDEEQTVSVCHCSSIGSGFGKQAYKLPVEHGGVDTCGVDACVIRLVARSREVAAASHYKIVAYLSGVASRHAKRIARLGGREAEYIAHALCRNSHRVKEQGC